MCKKCLAVFIIFIITAIAAFFVALKSNAQPPSVVINEIAWMGTVPAYPDDKSATSNEWIELYNSSGNDISLEGWILRSTDESPNKTLSGTIPAYGFFLLERTDDDTLPSVQADQFYTGALNNTGEHLELLDSQGNIVDDVNSWGEWFAGDNLEKTTMERKNPNLSGSDALNWTSSINPGGTPKAKNSVYQESSGQQDSRPAASTEPQSKANEPQAIDAKEQIIHGAQKPPEKTAQTAENPQEKEQTPAADITATTQTQDDKPLNYPSNIYINELMPSPIGDDSTDEWIEITNENDSPADLSGWQIKDIAGVSNTYTFPSGSSIAAKMFLVLSRPTTNITLNNDGDGLVLLKPNSEAAHSISYPKAPSGQSYARFASEWNFSDVPTPGSANIASAPKQEMPKPKPATENTPKPKAPEVSENTKIIQTTSTLQDSSITKTASIADSLENEDLSDKSQNSIAYAIPFLIAAASGAAIFALKKRA